VADNERRCIVYIEDDQNMIDLVADVLARDNFDVIGALEGHEGVALAREVKPLAILLDLMLPDTSGWVVYQLLKQDPVLRDVPVIVITARGAPIDKILGERIAKVQAYITKPFSTKALRDKVKHVLGME